MTDTAHPLDRPVWSALRGRQAALAIGDARALRFRPEYNLFAAAADRSPQSQEALGALVSHGRIALVEPDTPPQLDDTAIGRQAPIDQMLLTELARGPDPVGHEALGDADAPEMLALAQLTRPGPFFAKTGRMGDFVGVRQGGRLVAMAGERMRPDGFTEVSAVCTHPDHRGHGHAAALMRVVIARILARGEAAFLHVYPDNPAIALYEQLGFRLRQRMILTVLEPTGG